MRAVHTRYWYWEMIGQNTLRIAEIVLDKSLRVCYYKVWWEINLMCPNKPYQYTSDDYLKSRWKYWWILHQSQRVSRMVLRKLADAWVDWRSLFYNGESGWVNVVIWLSSSRRIRRLQQRVRVLLSPFPRKCTSLFPRKCTFPSLREGGLKTGHALVIYKECKYLTIYFLRVKPFMRAD